MTDHPLDALEEVQKGNWPRTGGFWRCVDHGLFSSDELSEWLHPVSKVPGWECPKCGRRDLIQYVEAMIAVPKAALQHNRESTPASNGEDGSGLEERLREIERDAADTFAPVVPTFIARPIREAADLIEHLSQGREEGEAGLREAVEAEVKALRATAERLKQTETDPRYGPLIVAEAHTDRLRCLETAAHLAAALSQHQSGGSEVEGAGSPKARTEKERRTRPFGPPLDENPHG